MKGIFQLFKERKDKWVLGGWGEDVGSQEKVIFSWKRGSCWSCRGMSRGYSYIHIESISAVGLGLVGHLGVSLGDSLIVV